MKCGNLLLTSINMSNSFIFKANSEDNDSNSELYYTLKGYEEFLDNEGYPRTTNNQSIDIAAKCIRNKKSKHFQQDIYYYSFYIRSTPNDSLYNPIEKYSSIEDKRQFEFIDKVCKEKWTFKEVSQVTFKKYLEFLKTKQTSWLKDAERDLK